MATTLYGPSQLAPKVLADRSRVASCRALPRCSLLICGECYFSVSPPILYKVEVEVTLLGVLLRVEMRHTMGRSANFDWYNGLRTIG
ncbi:unnamed protein product [Prunus armeniaca]